METGNRIPIKPVILVVSFGTSYNNSRELTIGAIEKHIAERFPEYEVRRAFTSPTIIRILKEREGMEIDNVEKALGRAAADGVKNLVVQPTHLMKGYEYMDLVKVLKDYENRFDSMVIGKPLLTDDKDFDDVIRSITEETECLADGKTAVCFMGHGTGAASNMVYEKLQRKLAEKGYEHYYIGTVEAAPSVDMIRKALKDRGGYERVVLKPLMVVAGDHANNDMAGDQEDSWKSVLIKEGYQVECVLEGLGQMKDIRHIYGSHVQEAISTVV